MKQGPPLSGNIAGFYKLLRFSTGHGGCAAGCRKGSGSVTTIRGSSRPFELGSNRATCHKQRSRDRDEVSKVRFASPCHTIRSSRPTVHTYSADRPGVFAGCLADPPMVAAVVLRRACCRATAQPTGSAQPDAHVEGYGPYLRG